MFFFLLSLFFTKLKVIVSSTKIWPFSIDRLFLSLFLNESHSKRLNPNVWDRITLRVGRQSDSTSRSPRCCMLPPLIALTQLIVRIIAFTVISSMSRNEAVRSDSI